MAGDLAAVHVRGARTGDRAAIEAVTLAAYQEYVPQMPQHWELYRQNIVGTLAKIEPQHQLVAEREGRIIGTVLLYPAGATLTSARGDVVTLALPEVRLLAVAPEGRGRGVGQVLMRECVRRARESGASGITLHTTDMMQTAMRLYERMGFMRAPELDLRPLPDVVAKGYRLMFTFPAP